MPVKLGLITVPRFPVSETCGHYELAERVGFDYGWMADYANTKDVYSMLTAVALRTSRIMLGPCVTNPYTRHPALTASCIATLDEVSAGRAILGIGAGDKTLLGKAGLYWGDACSFTREAVTIIRSILRSGAVDHDGKIFKVKGFNVFFKPTERPRILIGARGPAMLRLAGEIGDGVLLNYSHPLEVNLALKAVEQGAMKASRNLSSMETATCVVFSVGSDAESAGKPLKWLVALMAASALDDLLERHHIEMENIRRIRETLTKQDLRNAEEYVTKAMFETFTISGTVDYAVDRIAKLRETGLSQIILSVAHLDSRLVTEQLQIIGRSVIPGQRELR